MLGVKIVKRKGTLSVFGGRMNFNLNLSRLAALTVQDQGYFSLSYPEKMMNRDE